MDVPIADNIGLKGGQASTIALWTLIHFLWLIWKFKVTEKSLLVRGLRFSLPPKKLNYADYLTNLELFYRSIQNLDVLLNGGLDLVKTKIKDAVLSSFCFYDANVPQKLIDEELEALHKLSKNKNVVVQKADKGNSMVLVDRDIYVKH